VSASRNLLNHNGNRGSPGPARIRDGGRAGVSHDDEVSGWSQPAPGVACDDNFAVRLNRDGSGHIIVVTITLQVGRPEATGAEGLVERAVGKRP